jgi:hypothetical protein
LARFCASWKGKAKGSHSCFCFLPSFLPHTRICRGDCAGFERKRKRRLPDSNLTVYLTSDRARDAISSQERERLEFRLLEQRGRDEQARLSRPQLKIRMAPRPKRKSGSAWLAMRRFGGFLESGSPGMVLSSDTPAGTDGLCQRRNKRGESRKRTRPFVCVSQCARLAERLRERSGCECWGPSGIESGRPGLKSIIIRRQRCGQGCGRGVAGEACTCKRH